MDKELLSFVDFLQSEKAERKVASDVVGVFGLAGEMTAVEEANPGVFVYKVALLQNQSAMSYFQPRKMRVAELREKEEASKKAPGKKNNTQQTLQQTQLDQEEIEAERGQQELKEKEHYDRIDQEQDEHKKQQLILENPFQHSSILFNDFENVQVYSGAQVQQLEDDILTRKGCWLSFTREVQGGAEEIAKVKKNKPKGINNSDYVKLKCKGWLSLEELATPGQHSTEQRVHLQPDENEEEQSVYDFKNSFVRVKVILEEPLLKDLPELRPRAGELYPKQQVTSRAESTSSLVAGYNEVLVQVIENLNKEYYNQFGKDKQKQEKVKSNLIQTCTLQKQQEIMKRKEAFLMEMFTNDKYKNLKAKLRKVVLQILIDKFRKEQGVNGMTQEQKATLISQVYVFLVEQLRVTLSSHIQENTENIHEDLVIQQDLLQKERKRISHLLKKEPPSDRFLRLAQEQEMLGEYQSACNNYLNMLHCEQNNDVFYDQFGKFLIKNKKFDLAELAYQKAIELNKDNQDYTKIMILLLINRKRYQEALNMLQSVLAQNKLNVLYNLVASFVYQQMEQPSMQHKHWQVVQRVVMRNNQVLPPKQPPKYNINPLQLPRVKQRLSQQQELKQLPDLPAEQQDQCWMEMIDFFAENHMFSLVATSLELLNDTASFKYNYYQALIHLYNKQYNEAITVADQILEEKPALPQIFRIKALACFYSQKYYKYDETIQEENLLKKKPSFAQKLRLGYVYLLRKSWGEAEEVFLECIRMQENSGMSWLGLGISQLNLGHLKQSEESLCTANIYDPYNSDIWGYLAYLFLCNSQVYQAQCAFDKMLKYQPRNLILLELLADKWYSILNYNYAIESLQHIINIDQQIKKGEQDNGIFTLVISLGEVYQKLGNSYHMSSQHEKAIEMLNKAVDLLEGKNQKATVKQQIENIQRNQMYVITDKTDESDL